MIWVRQRAHPDAAPKHKPNNSSKKDSPAWWHMPIVKPLIPTAWEPEAQGLQV